MSAATGGWKRWLRGASLLLGAILLFWLPVEDTGTRTPLLPAALGVTLLAAFQLNRFALRPCRHLWVRHILPGALGGLAIPLLATGLMVFKSGIHRHGFPDYTPGQLFSVLL